MNFDEFLKEACIQRQLDWRKYRRASHKRVLERIYSLGLRGYKQYLSYLERHPEEATDLPNLLRVTVSRFFREKESWQELGKEILPKLISQNRDKTIRALSIGSCGGEEPYSLALLWTEYILPNFPNHKLNIVGLEVDKSSLIRASQAVYQEKTLREIPSPIKAKWFIKERGQYHLHPLIKDQVQFRYLDILKDPLPADQDIILCRYLVYTYFRQERQFKASQSLWQALKDNGLLMIGQKEGLESQTNELFQPWPGSRCFFQKRTK